MASDFIFRDALPGDRDEVLALTANTWEDGDYIHSVFDDWVGDSQGRFLMAVEPASQRIVGMDKLSFLSPTEAWFEGLRVHPDFRGRGLATKFQTVMLGEARRMGAQTVRLLTVVGNVPVHRKAYRDGFSARFVVRHWKWAASRDMSWRKAAPAGSQSLREATATEAVALHDWWVRSSAWHATSGLLIRNWSFSATSAAEWSERASRGEVLVPEETVIESLAMPPPLAIFSTDTNDRGGAVWTLSLVSALGSEWAEFSEALVNYAHEKGVAEIEGLLPDSATASSALREVGFTGDEDAECLCLFELRF